MSSYFILFVLSLTLSPLLCHILLVPLKTIFFLASLRDPPAAIAVVPRCTRPREDIDFRLCIKKCGIIKGSSRKLH
jgi:hypothetical protein